MTDRQVLLNRVMVCDFVLDETALFLDTHKDDKEALAYYNKYLALKKQASDEFIKQYGPLTQEDFSGAATWEWVQNPWPWENQGEA